MTTLKVRDHPEIIRQSLLTPEGIIPLAMSRDGQSLDSVVLDGRRSGARLAASKAMGQRMMLSS